MQVWYMGKLVSEITSTLISRLTASFKMLPRPGRWWLKRPLFFLINCVMNLADMVTDSLNFHFLWTNHQPHWALLTLFWMFTPFFLHLIIFVRNRRSASFVTVLIHLPFVIPFRNMYLFVKLCEIGYPYHEFEHSKDVEEILSEVGLASFYESFCEAGPQSVTTCVVFLCTGRISETQIVSLFTSLISLTWGASRAFFIQRMEHDADPDPNFAMVFLRVFPFMLVSVINSLVMWVLSWGFLGPYTFASLFMNYSTVLVILSLRPSYMLTIYYVLLFYVFFGLTLLTWILYNSYYMSMFLGLYVVLYIVFVLKSNINQEEKEYFSVMASLCALWVPCVIGSGKYSFKVSVILTLIMKLSELAVAYTLAFLGYQWRFYFLLWCLPETSFPDESDLALCSFSDSSFPPCFTTDTSQLQQQFRVCEENEENVRLYIFIGVTLTNLLAVLSSRELHKYSNYVNLYNSTHKLLWIIATTPVIHRSLLFSLVDAENINDLEIVLGRVEGKNLSDDVSRPNREGDTPLHNACKRNSSRCVELLLKAGAMASAVNSQKETALHIACQSATSECAKLLLKEGLDINARTKSNDTPLHFASKSSSLECAKALVIKGAMIEAINDNSETPLHISCQRELGMVAAFLINAGAYISATDKDRNTPLHNACRASADRVVKLLIDAGATLTTTNRDKETPLSIACTTAEESSAKIVYLLLKGGVKLNLDINRNAVFQILRRSKTHVLKEQARVLFESDKDILSELCRSFVSVKDWQRPYQVHHVVENKDLPRHLQKWWATKYDKYEEEKVTELLKQGFSFSFEDIADSDVEVVEKAVRQWNKKHPFICKYIFNT